MSKADKDGRGRVAQSFRDARIILGMEIAESFASRSVELERIMQEIAAREEA